MVLADISAQNIDQTAEIGSFATVVDEITIQSFDLTPVFWNLSVFAHGFLEELPFSSNIGAFAQDGAGAEIFGPGIDMRCNVFMSPSTPSGSCLASAAFTPPLGTSNYDLTVGSNSIALVHSDVTNLPIPASNSNQGVAFADQMNTVGVTAMYFTDLQGNPVNVSYTSELGFTYPSTPINVPEPGTVLLLIPPLLAMWRGRVHSRKAVA